MAQGSRGCACLSHDGAATSADSDIPIPFTTYSSYTSPRDGARSLAAHAALSCGLVRAGHTCSRNASTAREPSTVHITHVGKRSRARRGFIHLRFRNTRSPHRCARLRRQVCTRGRAPFARGCGSASRPPRGRTRRPCRSACGVGQDERPHRTDGEDFRSGPLSLVGLWCHSAISSRREVDLSIWTRASCQSHFKSMG